MGETPSLIHVGLENHGLSAGNPGTLTFPKAAPSLLPLQTGRLQVDDKKTQTRVDLSEYTAQTKPRLGRRGELRTKATNYGVLRPKQTQAARAGRGHSKS